MKIPIIPLANSKYIQIPNTVLAQYNIEHAVVLTFEKDHIRLKRAKQPRQGWNEAFRTMHENGDDELLIPDVFDDETFVD